MSQMTLEEALEQVQQHANDDWYDAALRFLYDLCLSREAITSDDLWKQLECTLYRTHEPRALGAVFREAAKEGWLRKTDRVINTTRPESHHRPIRVWESLLFTS